MQCRLFNKFQEGVSIFCFTISSDVKKYALSQAYFFSSASQLFRPCAWQARRLYHFLDLYPEFRRRLRPWKLPEG